MSHPRKSIASRIAHTLKPQVFLGITLTSIAGMAADGEDQSAHVDKSGYTLFHPTPDDQVRELSADRPDKTESAHTVDAGHFQLEMDFANMTFDRHNPEHADIRLHSTELAPMNLKVGILNNLDAHLTLTPYRWDRIDDKTTGTVLRKSGFGDLTPRLKVNLVGNDDGPFALSLLPFIKLPTNQRHLGNHSIEGGLKVPYAFSVPNWDVSLQTEVDYFKNDGHGYHEEIVNSISVGHSLIGKLSYYAEFYSSVSTERNSSWEGTLDTWFTYQVNKNLRLDAGIYIGVTRSADDWHPFIGMTWRY